MIVIIYCCNNGIYDYNNLHYIIVHMQILVLFCNLIPVSFAPAVVHTMLLCNLQKDNDIFTEHNEVPLGPMLIQRGAIAS